MARREMKGEGRVKNKGAQDAELLEELNEDAYQAGQNDKQAGRKPTPYRITLLVSPRWEQAFGAGKAKSLVHTAYQRGYKQNPGLLSNSRNNLWIHYGAERGREFAADNNELPGKDYIEFYATRDNSQYSGWQHMTDREHKSANKDYAMGFRQGFKGTKKQRNPGGLETATAVSEGFHGRAAEYIEEIIEIEKYRTKLAHLGDLVELEIVSPSGRTTIPLSFTEHDTEGHVSVASSSNREQLILSGGDQSVDLARFGLDTSRKDYLILGEIYSISYFTDKHHLEGPEYQKDGTAYIHEFGEETGERPYGVYDSLNSRILVAGGAYEVRDTGIWN